MREAGFGLKAATITPEGKDDVGSPNRILREEVDGKVIVRTGRRIPGVVGPVAGVHYPISVVRMAVGDAYGAKQWREGEAGAVDEVALRTERITRSHLPRGRRVRVPRPPSAIGRARLRRAEVDRLPRLRGHAQGGDGRRRRAPSRRRLPARPDRRHCTPGLISGAADTPLVIPALNRDGDCLSDLVMPMFGSIAGAESVLLAFDDDFDVDVAMAEAPHGTAPSLYRQGPREPDGDDPGLRRGARLRGRPGATRAPSAPRARSTRACSRPSPAASRRSTSAATRPRPSSPTPWSRRSGPRSTSGPRSARRSRRRVRRRPGGRARGGVVARWRRAPAGVQPALDGERQRCRRRRIARDVDRELGHASRASSPVPVGGGDADVGGRRDRRDRDQDADQRARLRRADRLSMPAAPAQAATKNAKKSGLEMMFGELWPLVVKSSGVRPVALKASVARKTAVIAAGSRPRARPPNAARRRGARWPTRDAEARHRPELRARRPSRRRSGSASRGRSRRPRSARR